jgi:hypothetical protein
MVGRLVVFLTVPSAVDVATTVPSPCDKKITPLGAV